MAVDYIGSSKFEVLHCPNLNYLPLVQAMKQLSTPLLRDNIDMPVLGSPQLDISQENWDQY